MGGLSRAELRRRLKQKAAERRKRRKPPQPPPRYDRTFHEGVAWLNRKRMT